MSIRASIYRGGLTQHHYFNSKTVPQKIGFVISLNFPASKAVVANPAQWAGANNSVSSSFKKFSRYLRAKGIPIISTLFVTHNIFLFKDFFMSHNSNTMSDYLQCDCKPAGVINMSARAKNCFRFLQIAFQDMGIIRAKADLPRIIEKLAAIFFNQNGKFAFSLYSSLPERRVILGKYGNFHLDFLWRARLSIYSILG